MNLTERKKQILQLVINEYIRTGKPVSSKFICEEYDLGCSPATIRNDLAILEEENFLTHPHTSAGRIPTDEGYKYYINFLMEIQSLTKKEEERIKKEFKTKTQELDKIMEQTSKMLATVSEYAGFVISTNLNESKIKYIEIVKIEKNKILVLIITEGNLVKHRIIQAPTLSNVDIKELANDLNKNFRGKKISSLKENVINLIIEKQKEKNNYEYLLNEIISNLDGIVTEKEYYLDENPNFLDNNDFSPYKILKEEKIINDILSKKSNGVQVYVGNQITSKSEYSLITSSYKVKNKTIGVLGIIGPKRMNYDKMVSLVDYISKLVSKLINEERG